MKRKGKQAHEGQPMKVGILYTDQQIGYEEDLLSRKFEEKSVELFLLRPFKVSYEYFQNGFDVFVEGIRVNDLDILLVRRTRYAPELSKEVIFAASQLGVPTIENIKVFFEALSKNVTLMRRASKFTSPRTLVTYDIDVALSYIERTTWPLIAKPEKGWKGIGISVLENPAEARKYVEEYFGRYKGEKADPILLQEKIDIKDEYRVLVVGEKSLGCCRKMGEKEKTARNYAQGAVFEYGRDRDLESMAVDMAVTLGIEIAGVDICETIKGENIILECNRNPQFKGFNDACADYDVAEEIVDYTLRKAKKRKTTGD